jgi:hypothetical protein
MEPLPNLEPDERERLVLEATCILSKSNREKVKFTYGLLCANRRLFKIANALLAERGQDPLPSVGLLVE